MGDTGPCGPCSEIHYDFGPEAAEPGREHEQFPLDGGGRFVEIWNLVFMQFNRDASGNHDAPAASLHRYRHGTRARRRRPAGQTLELRNRSHPPHHRSRRRTLRTSNTEPIAKSDTALRINADHARATAFLIHDGVLPSNEGRGYVLRKIMRRAMRNARLIGKQDPYLYELTGFVAELMRPGLSGNDGIRPARRPRRQGRRASLRHHLPRRRKSLQRRNLEARRTAPFPAPCRSSSTTPTASLSMSRKTWPASAASTSIAKASTPKCSQQRDRARASWKGGEKGAIAPAYQQLLEKGRTKFLGYDKLDAVSTVIGLLLESAARSTRSQPAPKAKSCSTRLPSTPKPAARSAIAAASLRRAYRRNGRRCRRHLPGRPRTHGSQDSHARPDLTSATNSAPKSAVPRALRHHAQSHRDAPASRRAPPGPRAARQAGRQRRRTAAPSFRFHPLRRGRSRRNRRSRASRQPADPPQHAGHHERDADRSGHLHRSHGAVRRKIRRGSSRRLDP